MIDTLRLTPSTTPRVIPVVRPDFMTSMPRVGVSMPVSACPRREPLIVEMLPMFDSVLLVKASPLWHEAQSLLPERGIERYTQGLMDLGATLCSTRAPRCGECPLATTCVAQAQGRPDRYPVKTRKLKRGARRNAMLWLVDSKQRLWLTQREHKGVWAGLWTLPLFDSLDALHGLLRGWPGRGEALPPINHALTHFDWRLEPWRHALGARVSAARRTAIEAVLPAGAWFEREEALAVGSPAPIRKLLTSY